MQFSQLLLSWLRITCLPVLLVCFVFWPVQSAVKQVRLPCVCAGVHPKQKRHTQHGSTNALQLTLFRHCSLTASHTA